MCLISIYYIQTYQHSNETQQFDEDGNIFIIYSLLIVHIASYISKIYRKRDIRLNGKPDANGIHSAKNEKILQLIEIFVDCALIGYVIRQMLIDKEHAFTKQTFFSYWILIDVIIMFLGLGYNYINLLFRTRQETIKNVYSLYFC